MTLGSTLTEDKPNCELCGMISANVQGLKYLEIVAEGLDKYFEKRLSLLTWEKCQNLHEKNVAENSLMQKKYCMLQP